jgi:AcrR family transcriptional regulator
VPEGDRLINTLSVKEIVLYCAKQEFLQYGFKDASLRSIAAAADMTTGAIYTYFKDKNELFEAIVEPVCAKVEAIFSELSKSYYNADTIVSNISIEKSIADLHQIYEFIYDNFDLFRLLVVGAEGSSRAEFVHTIVDYEVEHTLAYIERMNTNKNTNFQINRASIHAISESYINALLEPVRHNMSYEEALKNLEFLVTFYTGGWQSIFLSYSKS